ncbi:MAG: hypothetical protein ACI93N_001235 [Flavobacteriaceae bacterium]|jgi:hypothetical protein
MKVAIMQPYIFPYLGYFQLLKAVDDFVFYDDVNFIKSGWINRNYILVSEKSHLYTIPLSKSSSFIDINETLLHPLLFEKWKKKFLSTIKQSYKKAPYFNEVIQIIEATLSHNCNSIGALSALSVENVSNYLGLKKNFYYSSIDFKETKGKDSVERIVDIVKLLNREKYVNPIGGVDLYDKESFKEYSIELQFLEASIKPYKQFSEESVKGLSIIDVLMFNSIEETLSLINLYKLS